MQWHQPQRIWKELVLATAMTFCTTALFCADPASSDDTGSKRIKTSRSIARPEIGQGLTPKQKLFLRAAYRAAIARLNEKESCRKLFEGLDFEGVHAIGRHSYQQAESPGEKARCDGGIDAFTVLGQSRILICRQFHSLPQRRMTVVLIHEALHTAGLSEAPHDPNGLTSPEITRMVSLACSL